MVYVINKVPKVIQVSLGSKEMNDATNVYMTESEAYSALQSICAHETKLGHSGTGRVFCADCRKHFN
jgi:pyridoxal/pyridoxine/pyridoxamine kinase